MPLNKETKPNLVDFCSVVLIMVAILPQISNLSSHFSGSWELFQESQRQLLSLSCLTTFVSSLARSSYLSSFLTPFTFTQ